VKLSSIGALLSLGIAALLWVLWDGRAALLGGVFGLMATAIHVVAVVVLRRAWRRSFRELAVAWSIGMGLRLAGVATWAAAVLLASERFPALPTAIGFLGVLLPLLFTEMWFLE
jgi:hypothetical protein